MGEQTHGDQSVSKRLSGKGGMKRVLWAGILDGAEGGGGVFADFGVRVVEEGGKDRDGGVTQAWVRDEGEAGVAADSGVGVGETGVDDGLG